MNTPKGAMAYPYIGRIFRIQGVFSFDLANGGLNDNSPRKRSS